MTFNTRAVVALVCYVGLASYALLGFPGFGGGGGDQARAPARHLRASGAGENDGAKPGPANIISIILQILFAVAYYYKVVKVYPSFSGTPTQGSIQLQLESAPSTLSQTSGPNIFLSCCCNSARHAHTMDKVGILDYPMGVCLMMFCPFCTVCYGNAFTQLNEKLGGEKSNVCMSCLCTWCCLCCTVAQDAQSLDEATGARTGILSVEQPPEMAVMGQPVA